MCGASSPRGEVPQASGRPIPRSRRSAVARTSHRRSEPGSRAACALPPSGCVRLPHGRGARRSAKRRGTSAPACRYNRDPAPPPRTSSRAGRSSSCACDVPSMGRAGLEPATLGLKEAPQPHRPRPSDTNRRRRGESRAAGIGRFRRVTLPQLLPPRLHHRGGRERRFEFAVDAFGY
jgi:hypothetical protein